MLLQTFEDEADGRKLRTVRYLTGSATACQHTGHRTPTVDDARARVSTFGEWSRLRGARQNPDLPRKPRFERSPEDGPDVVETSNGESGGAATLDDHDGRVAPLVNVSGVGLEHLIVGKGAAELKKAVGRVLKRRLVGVVGMHPLFKGAIGDLGPRSIVFPMKFEVLIFIVSTSMTAMSSVKPPCPAWRVRGGERTTWPITRFFGSSQSLLTSGRSCSSCLSIVTDAHGHNL